MRILAGNDRFVGGSHQLDAMGALIGIANVAPDQWAELDRVARQGNFERAIELQTELTPLGELIFGEPVVEAVARIKTILKNVNLIAHDTARSPQIGVDQAEKVELLRHCCCTLHVPIR
jgi:4-hydroxy-tetrahydrodipicolinate synthase